MNRTQSPSHKTTLYVDTENLGGSNQQIRHKADLIARAVTGSSWPQTIPEATMIKAYCHSGEGARWEEAIRARLGRPITHGGLVRPSPLCITAPEVPRFGSLHKPAANAMDLTLMLETLSDLLTRQTKFAVIISNDSDYGHLLKELRKLETENNLDPPYDINGLPLLILTHNRAGLSEAYREFSENVRCIDETPRREPDTAPPRLHRPPDYIPAEQRPSRPRKSIFDSFTVSQLIQIVAAGIGYKHWNDQAQRYEFTAYHAHRAISGQHPATAAAAEETHYQPDLFQDWFYRNIWPVMGKKGASCRKDQYGRITYTLDQTTWLKLRNK